ncbi:hypothetical protein Tco_1346857 [Tanacetum coccineum]
MLSFMLSFASQQTVHNLTMRTAANHPKCLEECINVADGYTNNELQEFLKNTGIIFHVNVLEDIGFDNPRQETEVPQPSSPTQTYVANKVASTGVDVRHGGAATTVSSLDAGQGSGNIDKTPAMPYNLPLPRVHILGSDKGRMQHNELMDLLIKKVKRLEDKLNNSRRKRRLVLSEEEDSDIEILAQEDPSKQGRKIAQIDDDEGITLVQMEERKKIASIHEEASNFKPEEWDNTQARIEADEELAHRLQAQERERYYEADKAKLLVKLINERKRQFAQQRAQQRRNRPLIQAQQRSYMCNNIKHMGSHTLHQLRGYSFDEIKVLFEVTVKRVNTFTSMKSDDTVPKVVTGSSKRSAEEELGEESSKRQKIEEGSEPAEESKDKESDELSQEQLQQFILIVPKEGMNVEALHTKYPIIDWEVYTEDSRIY